MKFFTCSLFLLFSLFYTLDAQNFWQTVNSPHSVTLEAMVVAPDKTVYAAIVERGVFRLSPNNSTWESVNNNFPTDIFGDNERVDDLVVTAQGEVYALIDRKVYYLNDNDTWEVLLEDAFTWYRHIGLTSDGRLIIGADSGTVYISTDGQLELILSIGDIEGSFMNISYNGDGHNFVAMKSGIGRLYRFNDDGTNITPVLEELTSPVKMVYMPSSNGAFIGDVSGLRYSLDDGETWSIFILDEETPNSYIRQIFKPEPNTIYVSLLSKDYVSYDGGLNFELLENFLPNNKSFVQNGLSTIVNIEEQLYIQGGYCGRAFHTSTNQGDTWTSLVHDLQYPSIYYIRQDKQFNLYAKDCDKTLVSSNGGSEWSPFSINGFLINEFDSNSTSDFVAYSEEASKIYYKQEAATDWTDIFLIDEFSHLTKMIVGEDRNVYMHDQYSLYIFNHQSQTWDISFLPEGTFLSTQFAINTLGDVYYSTITPNLVVYQKKHDSLDWEIVFNSESFSPIAPIINISPSNEIYLKVEDNFDNIYYISTDNGETFTLFQTPNNQEIRAMGFNQEGHIFAATPEGVYSSINHGGDWQNITNNITYPRSVQTLYVGLDNYLYAGLNSGPLHKSLEVVSDPNLVIGQFIYDQNQDCNLQESEAGLSAFLIGTSSQVYDISNTNGEFAFTLPDGTHDLTIQAPNDLWEICPIETELTFDENTDSFFIEIPVQATAFCEAPSADIGVFLLRRCFYNTVYFSYCNHGTIPLTSPLEVQLDSFLNVFESDLPYTTGTNEQHLIFETQELAPGACQTWTMVVEVDCEAELGQEHCMEVFTTLDNVNCDFDETITPLDILCLNNIGSYDPNDKRAYTNGKEIEDYLIPEQDLDYMIRFQNTGTDTAFTVVIRDKLSPHFDLSTVRPGISSHPYSFNINVGRELEFTFENILLPDSTTNEMASHGFVKFSVAPVQDLALGTPIGNFADIYFDFNEPVRTNTVALTYDFPNSIQKVQPVSKYIISVQPNPFGEQSTIKITPTIHGQKTLSIFDSQGRFIKQQTFHQHSVIISKEHLYSGLYFFKISQEEVLIGHGKFVVF